MSQDREKSPNRLLAALPEDAYQRLKPYLIPVDLKVGKIIHEAGDEINTVYFPNKALISLVATLENGDTTEIALIGGTGVVGIPLVLGSGRSTHRAMVQLADGGWKISAEILKQEFDRGEELQKLLLGYIQTRMDEVAQLAVCNRHHTIEERLARWLLMVQDLVQTDVLPLTQEFIGDMLGVHRPGVTLTASAFQNAGLIRYSRGKITILDRQGIEDIACECYQLFHQHIDPDK